MSELKFCQSCGMPLTSSQILGSNADGSQNADYCVNCYQNGAFTRDCTIEEMMALSLATMKELQKNNPAFREEKALETMRQFFPLLKRWRQ